MWAVSLTLIVALGGAWMVWFGPEMQVTHPVRSDTPTVAAAYRSVGKVVTAPAQPEEIRKAQPAKPVLPPFDISVSGLQTQSGVKPPLFVVVESIESALAGMVARH